MVFLVDVFGAFYDCCLIDCLMDFCFDLFGWLNVCRVVLIDISICLCCLACVFHCCIDVPADRNGSKYTQNN